MTFVSVCAVALFLTSCQAASEGFLRDAGPPSNPASPKNSTTEHVAGVLEAAKKELAKVTPLTKILNSTTELAKMPPKNSTTEHIAGALEAAKKELAKVTPSSKILNSTTVLAKMPPKNSTTEHIGEALEAAKKELANVKATKHSAAVDFAKQWKLEKDLMARIKALSDQMQKSNVSAATNTSQKAVSTLSPAAINHTVNSSSAKSTTPLKSVSKPVASPADGKSNQPHKDPLPAAAKSRAAVTPAPPAAVADHSCSGCSENLSLSYQRCAAAHGNPCARLENGLMKDSFCCSRKEAHDDCVKCAHNGCPSTGVCPTINKEYYRERTKALHA